MSDWYELIGQTPVKIEGDIIECARLFEQMERRVAITNVMGMVLVSTVFLGLDHSFRGGRAILFETMAFRDGEAGYEQERCSTWAEAEAQHARMCADVVRPAAMFAYVLRTLKDAWGRAKEDLWRRWRRDVLSIELSDMEKMWEDMDRKISEREW